MFYFLAMAYLLVRPGGTGGLSQTVADVAVGVALATQVAADIVTWLRNRKPDPAR
jgi:hypothetical protein